MSRRLALTSAAIVLVVGLYVVVVVATSWRFATQEIIRERSPLAWLSSMLLTGAAVLAVVASLRSHAHRAFWMLAAALFALALDERFMGHERLKAVILARIFGYDRAAMGSWGDAPLALVPILGGALLWSLRRELDGRVTRALLVGALAAGGMSIALDIATLHPAAQVVEELLELAAETTLLLAMLTVVEMKSRA